MRNAIAPILDCFNTIFTVSNVQMHEKYVLPSQCSRNSNQIKNFFFSVYVEENNNISITSSQ